VVGGIDQRLKQIHDAGEADDHAVDLAEGGEAENLGGIVTV
jgi:hypothetical protein